MNTLITDRKYTVIVSAYQASNTDLQNLIATQRLHRFLEVFCHCHAISAVGVYKGNAEQSYAVHTNSSNTVSQIKRGAFELDNQECVLISNNRKHDIKLHNIDGTNTDIGKRFTCHDKAPKCDSYTVLNGLDYWSVN